MSTPCVSVIVPSYNCGLYLRDALESITQQTFTDYEVIIIDDGSTDDTQKIAQEYVKRFRDKFIYIHQENQGLACARNTGIRRAQGEYIALLDADDIWMPNRLEEGARILDKDASLAMIHANIYWMEENGNVGAAAQRDKKYLQGNIILHLFLCQAHISCPTVLVRKAILDTVGLFDEKLTRLGCEDRELWLRIARQYKIHYIDKPLACYRGRRMSMSRDIDKMFRARLYVIEKLSNLDPKLQTIKHKALSQAYCEIAGGLLFRQNFKAAQENSLTALKLWPLSLRPWKNLVKAFLKDKVRYAS